MFDTWVYSKYFEIRLFLVAVKRFSKNTYFPEMLIFGKGKYFHVFGCISKNFPENIFWCLEKKKEKTNPRKISSTIAIWDHDLAGARSRSTCCEIAISVEGEIAINCAISRRHDRDRRLARSCRRLRSRSKARSRLNARSRDGVR